GARSEGEMARRAASHHGRNPPLPTERSPSAAEPTLPEAAAATSLHWLTADAGDAWARSPWGRDSATPSPSLARVANAALHRPARHVESHTADEERMARVIAS